MFSYTCGWHLPCCDDAAVDVVLHLSARGRPYNYICNLGTLSSISARLEFEHLTNIKTVSFFYRSCLHQASSLPGPAVALRIMSFFGRVSTRKQRVNERYNAEVRAAAKLLEIEAQNGKPQELDQLNEQMRILEDKIEKWEKKVAKHEAEKKELLTQLLPYKQKKFGPAAEP